MVRKSKKDSSVTKLTESQVWLAEQAHTGFLVALWLDPETATSLALAGGESADNLHITLAYCGDAAEMSLLDKAEAIVAINNAVHYWSPVEGKVAGYGRFVASESSDAQDVFHALVDIPQLTELRQCIVNALGYEGIAVSANHGFTPHITLSYLDPEAENPVDSLEPLALKFQAVTIKDGETRIDIPFWQEVWPESTISMSESETLPLDAPLGAKSVRAMFGDFSKEWIPFLPVPGNYVHEKFGEMDLSSDAYAEMLQNFKDYVYKQDLPIRATHTPSDGGAIGYIKDMRLAEDGSLEVKPEWNELGKGLVDGDRFRYVSAEYCKTWTNPVTLEKIPNVAVGLALVTRPHFKTDVLNPLSESEALAFSEASVKQVSTETEDDTSSLPESRGQIDTTTLSDQKGITVTDEEKKALEAARAIVAKAEADEATLKLAEQEAQKITQPIVLSDLRSVVITAEQRENERIQFADLESRVVLAERRATNAESKTAELINERRMEKFTAEVTGRSAENGVAWFGSVQENVQQLVSLAEKFGDDSEQVRYTVRQKRTEATAIRKSGIFDSISLSANEGVNSINSQVAVLAEQLRKQEPGLTKEQAETRVYDEHPEFYAQGLTRRG